MGHHRKFVTSTRPVGVFHRFCKYWTPQKQNGFRYTLTSTSSRIVAFGSREPSGSFFDLSIAATIFIGGDLSYLNTGINFWLQNVRLYLNYFPDSVDEMINLAIMDTGNFFYAVNIAHLTPFIICQAHFTFFTLILHRW